MPKTREEYVALGDTLSSPAVIEQLSYSIMVAERDATLLASHGWSAEHTNQIKRIRTDLDSSYLAYQAKFGVHIARSRTAGDDIDTGKRWRLRAVAIGRNVLEGDAAAELSRYGTAAGRDAAALGAQIAGVLSVATKNETTFRGAGADDGFFAEGRRLVAALELAAAHVRNRPKDLPAEHDRIDELDGRAHELLVKLNRSGRASHLSAGDRARMTEYNLDVLHRRPIRARAAISTVAPAAATV